MAVAHDIITYFQELKEGKLKFFTIRYILTLLVLTSL